MLWHAFFEHTCQVLRLLVVLDSKYSVPCEEPPDIYISQTKRKLKARIFENERSCEADLTTIQPNTTNDTGIPIH